MLPFLLKQIYRRYFKKDDDDEKEEKKMEGFMSDVVKDAVERFKRNNNKEENKMDNIEGFFEEMGRSFGRRDGSNRRTGKGRHSGIRQRRGDRKARKAEMLEEAGLDDAERFDAGNLFMSANRSRKWYKRIGVETAMGMDATVRTILTTATGTPTAQAQTDFEIQGIRIQHNGDGATAAATIAIHETLLAHLAFTQIKVGDDNMLTTSNMVGAYVFSDRETEGGDLAGYVATTTQQVSMSIVNNAAYSALIITSAVGEVVSEYKGD